MPFWLHVGSNSRLGCGLCSEYAAFVSLPACRFEGTLLLRPGKYRVKFMVDNEWRIAADWPTEMDDEGNEVCLLTVT